MRKLSDNYYEFTIEELKHSLGENGNIVIPLYQRGITWKKNQREDLIDTLINGYPFGCILLNRYNEGNYRIIDGLQRSYSLIDYYDKPVDYFTERYISDDEIVKIAKLVNNVDEKEDIMIQVPRMVSNYVRSSCSSLDELCSININELVVNIVNNWNSLFNRLEEIKVIVKEIIDNFINNYKKITTELRIPAQIFEAPEDKLPEIFERINIKGSKLTRFQVYAATWSDDKVKISGKDLTRIVDNVRIRYEEYLKNTGVLSSDDFDSQKFKENKEVNIFDMIYGFGRMICSDYPMLFNGKSEDEWDKNDVPSIGFNLINACLFQKSSNMGRLNKSIEEIVGFDQNRISAFLHYILECIGYVSNKLSRGIGFKGNKNIDVYPSPIHTELQIVSIIASLFISKYLDYDEDDNGEISNISMRTICNPNWPKEYKKGFDKNVLKIYSEDLIKSNWKGSGDSKLYNVLLQRKYYTRNVDWEEFEDALDNYYDMQKKERNERTKVANPCNADKLILNLIYSSILSAGDQIDDSGFDIEHLATKSIMKAKIKKYNNDVSNFSLPISSIGNLCLLPREYNELKGEKLMYEFTEHRDSITKEITVFPIKEYEKKYSFTVEKDFEWLRNADEECNCDEFADKYYKFLDNRFRKMKNRIKSNLFPIF